MTLALQPKCRYLQTMLVDLARRISAALLTLALVFGPAAMGVHASSMGAKIAVAASNDTHSPGKCDDCGAAKAGISAGVCSVVTCSGISAIPSSEQAVFDWLPAETFGPYDPRHRAGHADPPDPYPPRLTILS